MAAAGGAALSGPEEKEKRRKKGSKALTVGDGEEGPALEGEDSEAEAEEESGRRARAGAAEPGLLMAAAMLSAFDTARMVVASMDTPAPSAAQDAEDAEAAMGESEGEEEGEE